MSEGLDSADAEARALLILDGLPGIGLVTVRALVDRFGSATASLEASRGAFARIAGDRAAGRRTDREILLSVDRAVQRADRLGIEVVTWRSPRYPEPLWHLADPPPVLFLRGNIDLLGSDAVTVVGARRATSRSRDLAERLGRALAEAGVTVISGMALGVDGAAHRGALDAHGDTVAVLGTGADIAYPRSHYPLFRRILDRGLAVSEFLPGTPALPHHFPRRNRILAALARVTVVVEAGVRSGSLITVDHALDLGRDVWVVPGPIEQAACAGSNRLLGDGARPLLSVSEFVDEIAPEAEGGAASRHIPSGPKGRVLLALADRALDVDELAARLDLLVPAALALLTEMEMQGSVRRLPGMRFRRAS